MYGFQRSHRPQPIWDCYSYGNVIRQVNVLGHETRLKYEDSRHPLLVTESIDANGLVVKYQYDAEGNLTQRSEQYCGCPNATPGITYYTYNSYGQQTSLVLPTGASLFQDYDADGNLLTLRDGKGNVIQSYTYYPNGLVKTETDATGTTSYTYNRFGYPTQSIDSRGHITSMEYDLNGKLKRMVEDNGTPNDTSDDEISTFQYDALGRETFADYGNGIWVKYDYEGAGNTWTKLEAPTIGTIERKLTPDGKLAGWVTADGGTPTFLYDNAGRLWRETDATGEITTEYGYDTIGRVTSIKDVKTGAITTKKYDPGNRVIEEINPIKVFTRYHYNPRTGRLDSTETGKYLTDTAGNLILDASNNPTVDPSIDLRTYRYEYNGTTTTVIDPLGRKTTSVNDDYYLPKETIYQLRDGTRVSEKSEYLYSNNLQEAKDYPTRIVDIGGKDRVFEYDEEGRLKSATDLGNNKYTYTYGEEGLSLITSPTGETRRYEYDDLGNLAKIIYEDNTSKEMTYRSSDNRLGTLKLQNGETITYDYDTAGRIITQTSSTSGTTRFTYTPEGAVETMTDSTGTTAYRYDSSNRLAGIDSPNGSSISYTYDSVGRVKTVTEKGSATGTAYTTQYDYDVFGNLQSIEDPNGGITTMKYDVVNRLSERTLANGVKTTYEYDDLDRIKSIVHTNAQGTILASVTYERQGIGEPTQITREDGSYTQFQYDESLRVTKESHYNTAGTLLKETTYSYDASGKRLVQSSTDNTRTFDYGNDYQLDTVTESGEIENYDYDANGRLSFLQRDGKVLDLNHDANDRLTTVENQTTGETTQYIYDSAGNRIKAVEGTQERRFLVAPAGGQGLESTELMTDGSGNLISNYVYGGGNSPLMRLDANGDAAYYLTDAMGSVIGLADGNGQSAGRFLYDAYGNILKGEGLDAAAGGDFRFQGQWLEETGLYHFRARDYDPRTGLFLSRDAVDLIEMEPESFNPYQFVYGNPLVYSDPTGMFTITEIQSAHVLEQALNSIRQYTVNEARGYLKDKVYETLGKIALNTLEKYVPFSKGLTIAIKDAKNAGTYFENWVKENFCDILPETINQVFFEPGVTQEGQAYDSGYSCDIVNLSPSQRTLAIRDRQQYTRKNTSRPDFIITPPGNSPRYASKGKVDYGGPNRSWLVGDMKLSVKTLYNDYVKGDNSNKAAQWNAMEQYAFWNAYGFIGFITLFGEGEKNEYYVKELTKKAVSSSFPPGLIIASIFSNAKSPFF